MAGPRASVLYVFCILFAIVGFVVDLLFLGSVCSCFSLKTGSSLIKEDFFHIIERVVFWENVLVW